MALTVDQWYSKVKKWVPGWNFESDIGKEKSAVTQAMFYAIAAFFARVQQDVDDAQASTFLLQSSSPVIDLLGDERGVYRVTGETDGLYAPRIQNGLFAPVGGAQLLAAINAVLPSHNAYLIENQNYGFFDDSMFFDDYFARSISGMKHYNWWTLIVPPQNSDVDFNFYSAQVISVIEANKALGTTYDVWFDTRNYLTDESGNVLTDESGNPLLSEG